MILSVRVMESMVDNVEFVRELVKIIKNCFQKDRIKPHESKKNQPINYTTCEGEIQIEIEPNENIAKVFFKNELKKKRV